MKKIKKPLITDKEGNVKEYYIEYSLMDRLGYWDRNPFIFNKIPTSIDIHIHNTFKDIKKG